jgi:hypothetical protein
VYAPCRTTDILPHICDNFIQMRHWRTAISLFGQLLDRTNELKPLAGLQMLEEDKPAAHDASLMRGAQVIN